MATRLIRIGLTVFALFGWSVFPDDALAQTLQPFEDSTSTYLSPLPEGGLINEQEIRVVVRLKSRRVYVYQGKAIVGSYAIAVGKPGWETPAGQYRVFSKEVNPTFKNFKTGRVIPPGPNNPLGVRWIGFWSDGKTQIGFHGTDQPNLIGQAVSHGCIRMRNKDVLQLFAQVSLGTPVIVRR